MPDTLMRGLVARGSARFVAVDVTEAAKKTQELHHLNIGAASLAAECLVAATLMSAYIKGEERITLQLQAEHPPASFMADVDSEGFIRARIRPQQLHFTGSISGILVVMNSDFAREIYRGTTEVSGQSIESALGNHLHDSNQVPATIRLGAVHDGQTVTFAGGILVERLPVEDEEVANEELDGCFADLRESEVEEVVRGVLHEELLGGPVEPLFERELKWQCRCGQHKVEAMVGSLGKQDLSEMIDEGRPAEVTCHFCSTTYYVEVVRLEEMKVRLEKLD
ncbi:MAG: Hsp33 family molecular chaperone HslO [Proteobacteria bacterium]|jgi:molecular chaperone Hsp33|nr:Hsp33 family molecular chaperone HslO [Pseudomonadota bacterium]